MSALVLPLEPVDGFEIVAWEVDYHRLELDELRWRFHVRRSCAEVLGPSYADGVDWINDWECIRGGRCRGRITGWQRIRHYFVASYHLELDAARAELRRLVSARIEELQGELARLQQSHPEMFRARANEQAAHYGALQALKAIPDLTISKWACDPGGRWNPVREALRALRQAQGFDVDVEDPDVAFDEHGWLRSRGRAEASP